jgi:hypothetical protein
MFVFKKFPQKSLYSFLFISTSWVALAAPQTAQAADLPSRKSKPVEYVKVCSTEPEAFFVIPGTNTCMRVGGRVRAEYRYFEPRWTIPGDGRALDSTGTRMRANLNIDTRTATEFGTLRTFFSYEMNAHTGVYGASVNLVDKAFIQFAGITAGRAASFYDFYGNDMNYAEMAGSELGTQNLLAYTATFGNFSATLSLEDRRTRDFIGGNYLSAGQNAPDVVGVLRYDDEKGLLSAAQLSAATHQLRSRNRDALGQYADTDYGFAVQGGLKFNLPFADGDSLWLQAAYSQGGLNYLGLQNIPNSIGVLGLTQAEAVVINGNISATKAYAFTAALKHYWTPTVRSQFYGAYASLDYSPLAANPAIGGLVDTRIYQLGSALVWSPVKDFDIGLEVMYHNIDPQGSVALPLGGTRGSEDAFEGRLRFQRDF